MKFPSCRSGIVIAAVLIIAALGISPTLRAQYGGSGGGQQQAPPPSLNPQQQKPTQQPPAAQTPADPEEDKAYKAFADVKPDAFDQQIQTGEQYLQKYPTGRYAEQVYSRLVTAYFQKNQLDKMYAASDK